MLRERSLRELGTWAGRSGRAQRGGRGVNTLFGNWAPWRAAVGVPRAEDAA
jgi:hypothetical protein